MVEDVFYLVDTPHYTHICLNRKDALEYYTRNNGFMIRTKTKDIFPKFDIILENNKYVRDKKWFVLA